MKQISVILKAWYSNVVLEGSDEVLAMQTIVSDNKKANWFIQKKTFIFWGFCQECGTGAGLALHSANE